MEMFDPAFSHLRIEYRDTLEIVCKSPYPFQKQDDNTEWEISLSLYTMLLLARDNLHCWKKYLDGKPLQ